MEEYNEADTEQAGSAALETNNEVLQQQILADAKASRHIHEPVVGFCCCWLVVCLLLVVLVSIESQVDRRFPVASNRATRPAGSDSCALDW